MTGAPAVFARRAVDAAIHNITATSNVLRLAAGECARDIVGRDEPIQIAGAGPAGLAAAITLARAGWRVIVHEAQREDGYRFQNDPQGLENWTTARDVIDELREMALTKAFALRECRDIKCSHLPALQVGITVFRTC